MWLVGAEGLQVAAEGPVAGAEGVLAEGQVDAKGLDTGRVDTRELGVGEPMWKDFVRDEWMPLLPRVPNSSPVSYTHLTLPTKRIV